MLAHGLDLLIHEYLLVKCLFSLNLTLQVHYQLQIQLVALLCLVDSISEEGALNLKLLLYFEPRCHRLHHAVLYLAPNLVHVVHEHLVG